MHPPLTQMLCLELICDYDYMEINDNWDLLLPLDLFVILRDPSDEEIFEKQSNKHFSLFKVVLTCKMLKY